MQIKSNTDSWLSRRNPTIKLTVVLISTLSVSFIFDPWRPFILWMMTLTFLSITSKLSLREMASQLRPFFWVACLILIVNILTRHGEILFEFYGIDITQEGITVGLSLALRTLYIGTLSIAFISSTNPVSLMTSLTQHAKLSPKVSYSVLTGFRMVQLLKHDWQIILAAQKIRLNQTGSRSFWQKLALAPQTLRIYRKALFTLLVTSIRRSERIAYSLESRGLGLSPRTIWHPVALTLTDGLFGGTSLLMALCVIVFIG